MNEQHAGFFVRTLTAAKDGNTDAEYEDAWAVGDGQDGVLVGAVADGATSALFARRWAQLLTEEFTQTPWSDARFAERLSLLGQKWRAEVTQKNLPWYTEEKLQSGSHAALLVVWWNRERWVYSARAVGDCCLFHLTENGRLRRAFPLSRLSDFGNRPALLSTERAPRDDAIQGLDDQPFENTDRFLLATDALAAYFIHADQVAQRPWNELPTAAAFPAWLAERRRLGRIKNDDVTLIELRPTPDASS